MSTVLDARPARPIAWQEWLPVLIGLLALYLPTFYGLATGIWQDDDYAHGPIILAVVLWLIWDKRAVLWSGPAARAPGAGVALLVFGLLLYVLGRSQGISVLEIGALIPILGGVLVAMRGWAALRASWFLLLFIVYLVPLPGTFVDAITGPLKQNVSLLAENILYSAGYPIARNGVMLTIGNYQLLVADACSGINSMFSLSAVGLLYLYLMRHKSWLHNAIVLACLLPIAFIANTVRVVVLVLITYYFGDEAGQGFVHQFSGMVLFVVALLTILLIDAVLTRIFRPAPPATPAPEAPPAQPPHA
jgi:exosortase B